MSLLKTLLLCGFLIQQSNPCFEGSWQVVADGVGEDFIFNIELTYQNGVMSGRHCFAHSGGWDCATEESYSLSNHSSIGNDIVELDFVTGYGVGAESADDLIGKVQLKLFDCNTIQWEVIARPASISLVPEMAVLRKSD